jgi:hypothetical protein
MNRSGSTTYTSRRLRTLISIPFSGTTESVSLGITDRPTSRQRRWDPSLRTVEQPALWWILDGFRVGEMGRHRIVRIDDQHYEVILENAPANCTALTMAPTSMEDALRIDEWLVLLVAVWSVPDIAQIDIAMRMAVRFPHLMVGVRPFDSPHENSAWLPEATVSIQSPIWILLGAGTIRRVSSVRSLTKRSPKWWGNAWLHHKL